MNLQPLEKIKILDITHYIAGPYCTKLLAEYGAEVIKVERPEGDPARRLPPFFQDDPYLEKSGTFLYLNTGKKGITLNLKTESGKKIFKELVKKVDALIENFEPRVLPSLGLDYSVLKEINPHLVQVSISNFGQWGPYRDFKASELILFAMSGWMQLVGESDKKPIMCGIPISQFISGTSAAMACLAALWDKKRRDSVHIDISILETMIVCLESLTSRYAYNKTVLPRMGGRKSPSPCSILPCKDGYFLAFAVSEKEWRILCDFIGKPDLKDDPRFNNRISRMSNSKELNEILTKHFMLMTSQEIYQKAQEHGLGFAKINNAADLIKWPHLKERKWFISIEHPICGKLEYPGLPFKILNCPPKELSPAPLLGQHNLEIYGKYLGFSEADLRILKERGII
jgi:crotonobetainyl-CoA:carnitine CoA-transferase CaiB-like acyl-CoA transferase